MTGYGDRTFGGGAAPDVVAGASTDALAAVGEEMPLKIAERCHAGSIPPCLEYA
jgi:hypothetical protein